MADSTKGALSDVIATSLRQQELSCRQKRRADLRGQFENLMLRMQNEGMLADEKVPAEWQEIHQKAEQKLAAQDENLRRLIQEASGYWKRLWWALWGGR